MKVNPDIDMVSDALGLPTADVHDGTRSAIALPPFLVALGAQAVAQYGPGLEALLIQAAKAAIDAAMAKFTVTPKS